MIVICFLFPGCHKTSDQVISGDPLSALNLPATPFAYANQFLPAYLLSPNIAGQDNTPANNPVSDWGATLGRVLFYDKSVSINNKISCASCHNQSLGFSDSSLTSKGFEGGQTARHSMSLVNAKYIPIKNSFGMKELPRLKYKY
jgi:cytochrome c peroxidase